jgi:peptidoglycan/xylan/chitin deacetylase (PgdA/CDA1 family)
MVQAAPGLAAEIASAGHEIAVRGWEHRYATVRGPGALHDDLARACDTIAAATGAVPRLLDECACRGLRAGPLAGHLADGPRPG